MRMRRIAAGRKNNRSLILDAIKSIIVPFSGCMDLNIPECRPIHNNIR